MAGLRAVMAFLAPLTAGLACGWKKGAPNWD